MKTQIIGVTPEQARKWLLKNEGNRPIRPMAVESLKVAYERGEWKLTHQGIAFSPDGRLIDGQHRLTFISTLPDGKVVPMMVSTGVSEDVFRVLDKGIKRSTADSLGKSGGLVAVGKLFARIHNWNQARALTDSFSEPYIELVEPFYDDLVGFCCQTAAIWSSAPVKAAAIYTMIMGGDDMWVKNMYHALVTSNFKEMPESAQALYRQRDRKLITASKALETFVRCAKAFDPRKSDIQKIQINDMSADLHEVRVSLDRLVGPIKIHGRS